jgi:modulator of FtsH protease HflC
MEHRDEEQALRRKGVFTIAWQIALAAIVVALILAYGSTFQVSEGYNAVVTRFGDPVRVISQPGLHAKWPWPMETAHPIDMRHRFFNTPLSSILTRDRRNVAAVSYVVWSVENPLMFFRSLGTLESAEQKLDGMVTASTNVHFGRYDLTAVVSTNQDDIQLDGIEEEILADVRDAALEKFGVKVDQVGVKRVAFPEENVSAVLAQMRSERNAEAQELRARGTKEAQRIRDEAMVKADEILAEGKKRSGDILGAAEQQSAAIYAQAHQLDPDFYRFWRSMQVIKKTMGSQTTVILRNDQEPFNALFQSNGLSIPGDITPARPRSPGTSADGGGTP